MEKNEKIKILIIVLLMLMGAYWLLTLVVLNAGNDSEYEFYDFNDNYGTSSKCVELENESLSCIVNKKQILVKQFSKIE